MNPIFWSSQTVLSFLIKNFKLATLLAGAFMLSVMLAEGCVKRPDLEPASGVSPKILGEGKAHRNPFFAQGQGLASFPKLRIFNQG